MDYINFVDIESKKIYDLGKASEAKFYLPFLAHKYAGKPVVLYGDETHCYLEDKYLLKAYGGEYEEISFTGEDYDIDALFESEIGDEEFANIFEKIGGKIIRNLEDFVNPKYFDLREKTM